MEDFKELISLVLEHKCLFLIAYLLLLPVLSILSHFRLIEINKEVFKQESNGEN